MIGLHERPSKSCIRIVGMGETFLGFGELAGKLYLYAVDTRNLVLFIDTAERMGE